MAAEPAIAAAGHHRPYAPDFGVLRDRFLDNHSQRYFGVLAPLPRSSTESVDASVAQAYPLALVTAAPGLHARVVASGPGLAPNIDMMALWPPRHPTYLIACNEQDPANPGIQRIRLSDGYVQTILTGTDSCDPVHATPWGTLLVGEEAGSSGTVLEIIHPLRTTGVVYDREAGTFSGKDAGNVTERPALGHLAFEGVAVLPNGVVYYGDENRPSEGTPGGAYFKFVPTMPRSGWSWVNSLAESPLADGTVYGLRLGLRDGGTDYGQGSNKGLGAWVEVEGAYDGDLRAAAATLSLTGYYRPEDAAVDDKALSGAKSACAATIPATKSRTTTGVRPSA